MSETPLDLAHRAMQAAPEDDAARLRFYAALADADLFLLLEREPEGEAVEPAMLEVEGAALVLGFDREERLADFAKGASAYAALSGRALVQMLRGQGVGLGLNLDVAPSAALLPADVVDWLAGTLDVAPEEAHAAVTSVEAPSLPEPVIAALAETLTRAGGLARAAWLVRARYQGGPAGHLLAVVDAAPGAEAAIAKAAGEALGFSGQEGAALDVTFVVEGSEMAARLAAVGRRFDMPAPERDAAVQVPGAAPGMDPAKPPILR